MQLTLAEQQTQKTRHRARAKQYAAQLPRMHGALKKQAYRLMIHHLKAMLS